jgi:ribonuclease HI
MSAIASLVIYTDGACQGNPGPGGWAWAVAPEGIVNGSGGEARSTNQRMEVQAVLEALRAHADVPAGSITIVSDSTYVVNCFRDRWWVRWQQNGWKNSKKEPVANPDLWKPLIELVQSKQPAFRWVKGHSGDPMNDLVDRLAVIAAQGPFAASHADATSSPDAVPAQDPLFD